MTRPPRHAAPRVEPEPLPGWLAWPIRAIAVIVVVPLKLAWDLLGTVSRFLWRYVGAPVTRFLYRYLLRPLAYALYYVIWVPIHWTVVTLFWRPLVWLAKHVLEPLLVALWRGLAAFVRLLGPFWRLLGQVLFEVAKAVGWGMSLVYRYVLIPAAQAIAWTARAVYRYGLRPVGLAIAWVWRWVVAPLASAVVWAWNHSVVLLWRYLVVLPVSWTWRTVVAPTGRWLRAAILTPAAESVRRVLATLGLR